MGCYALKVKSLNICTGTTFEEGKKSGAKKYVEQKNMWQIILYSIA